MTDPPGAAIVRGPMATDNLTQVHNLAVRGQIIHTRYVGVWAYITSHREGWRLTEHKIAKDLGVGRDFVRSALANIEAAGCLVRAQERGPDGTFGVSIWFITDLPFQLRTVGVTDPATIAARVEQQYRRWRSRRSRPRQENPAPGVTSANSPGEQPPPQRDSRRSRPLSDVPATGGPTSGEPAADDPTQKNTKGKNTNRQDHQPATTAGAPGHCGPPPAGSGRLVGDQPRSGSAGEQLVRSLPATHRLAGHSIRWAAAIADRALTAGWTGQRLLRTLTEHTADAINPPGVVVARLKDLAAELDTRQVSAGSVARPPWCGECDERSRLVLRADGRMARCPNCNPPAVADRRADSTADTSSSLTEREGRPGDDRQPDRGR